MNILNPIYVKLLPTKESISLFSFALSFGVHVYATIIFLLSISMQLFYKLYYY
jgi:hypothetical protein